MPKTSKYIAHSFFTSATEYFINQATASILQESQSAVEMQRLQWSGPTTTPQGLKWDGYLN